MPITNELLQEIYELKKAQTTVEKHSIDSKAIKDKIKEKEDQAKDDGNKSTIKTK